MIENGKNKSELQRLKLTLKWRKYTINKNARLQVVDIEAFH